MQNNIIVFHKLLDQPVNLNSLLLRLKSDTTTQWYLFGLAVGLPRNILEELKSYPREQRLVEVLDYWLRHYPGQPTWQEVVIAQEKVKFYQSMKNTDIDDAHSSTLSL